jgi:hypothetical protein
LDVTLKGTGEAGVLTASTYSVTLSAPLGASVTRRIPLRNRGKGVLSGSIPAIQETLEETVSVSPTGPFTLKPGTTLPLSITFSPAAEQLFVEVTVLVSAPSQPQPGITIQVSGKLCSAPNGARSCGGRR